MRESRELDGASLLRILVDSTLVSLEMSSVFTLLCTFTHYKAAAHGCLFGFKSLTLPEFSTTFQQAGNRSRGIDRILLSPRGRIRPAEMDSVQHDPSFAGFRLSGVLVGNDFSR